MLDTLFSTLILGLLVFAQLPQLHGLGSRQGWLQWCVLEQGCAAAGKLEECTAAVHGYGMHVRLKTMSQVAVLCHASHAMPYH